MKCCSAGLTSSTFISTCNPEMVLIVASACHISLKTTRAGRTLHVTLASVLARHCSPNYLAVSLEHDVRPTYALLLLSACHAASRSSRYPHHCGEVARHTNMLLDVLAPDVGDLDCKSNLESTRNSPQISATTHLRKICRWQRQLRLLNMGMQ